MKSNSVWITLLTVFCVIMSAAGSISIGILTRCHYEQQRQIDQLCQITLATIKNQESVREGGIVSGKQYCFYFADYNRGIAVLEEYDGDVRFDYCNKQKPRYVIMYGVDQRNLEYWSKRPLLSDKYRKIY